ncbi:MAG: hypothetical protein ABSG42_01220 [Nitrospirota bacterium]
MAVLSFARAGIAGGQYENPMPGMFQSPALGGSSLGPVGEDMYDRNDLGDIKDYTIGFRGPDNSCMVKDIPARSEGEALDFASSMCPDCQLQDITGYDYGKTPWEITPKKDAYCAMNTLPSGDNGLR